MAILLIRCSFVIGHPREHMRKIHCTKAFSSSSLKTVAGPGLVDLYFLITLLCKDERGISYALLTELIDAFLINSSALFIISALYTSYVLSSLSLLRSL